MNFSKETLGLALLTLLTVVLIKGPILSRWELFQSLKSQVAPLESQDATQAKYGADLIQAKIKLAQKQLDALQPSIPNQPFAFVKTLQDLSAKHGCTLSNWAGDADTRWRADLTGSASELTALLHELETAMPALNLESAALKYKENAVWMELTVLFPEEASDGTRTPSKGGSLGSNRP